MNIRHRKTGRIKLERFRPKEAKEVLDRIDSLAAQHYGLTDGDLDFILNYDIKYRMGDELFEDDE